MTDTTPAVRIAPGHVYVEVSGLTGSGKSAVMGEIEIALKALGLTVEHDAAFQAEKNGTHADWQEALDLYKPTVVLTERNVTRALSAAPVAPGGEGPMTNAEVEQWIDACNHEPARQVLRDYLALRARSSPDLSGGGEREAVARIVDPKAWELWDTRPTFLPSSRLDSLAKADRILAALSPSREGGEPEAGVVAWDTNVLNTIVGTDEDRLTREPVIPKTGERIRSSRPLYAHPTPAEPEAGAVDAQAHRLLQLADAALANVTAFESDARYIMGNTNYAITDNARSEIRRFLLAHPTPADDRLAVAVAALKPFAAEPEYWSETATPDNFRISGFRFLQFGHFRRAAEALALLTSGEQPVSDPYKLDSREAGK